MKVLLVADLYPPLIGGTERHVQNLARELIHRGHSVAVATMQPSGSPLTEVDEAGVRVYRIDRGWASRVSGAYASGRPHHPSIADPGVAAALRVITSKELPDVVYAHNWMLYSYLAAAGRHSQVPVLACLHDYWPICPARSLVSGGQTCQHDTLAATIRCGVDHYGRAKGTALAMGLWDARRRWHHRVDRYLAVSQFVADACLPALAGKQAFVAPTFVSSNLAAVIENTPAPDFLPDGPYLLYVGRLSAAKGVTVLADAYRQLGASAPPLLVLGAQDAGCEVSWPAGVRVLQDVPHHQVMAAWRHAEVGIIPSTYPEPFGQVAIEAMAVGIPVIASDVGGLAEVVGKYPGGTLVPAGSPTALAEGIRHVLSDPQQRMRARAVGPAAAARFLVSNVADIVERHLTEVIESHFLRETSV